MFLAIIENLKNTDKLKENLKHLSFDLVYAFLEFFYFYFKKRIILHLLFLISLICYEHLHVTIFILLLF